MFGGSIAISSDRDIEFRFTFTSPDDGQIEIGTGITVAPGRIAILQSSEATQSPE